MPTEGENITSSIRLVRELGAGGMGSVWIADHTSLQTQVVVKFMHAALVADKESLARFSREAAAGANVKSPHVVQVYDHGITPDGTPFIVMELLEGCDLDGHLEKNGLVGLAELEKIVTQVCKALSRAHERGIVHRDIKPQNIFLTNLGGDDVFVKVLDFGIAKASDLQNTLGTTTKTGAAMGTPYYMSPEQIIGSKTIDHRTDLWALGVVAFECLAGKKPFDGETLGGLALTICNGPMPVPSTHHPALPAELDRWFLRACARELTERFSSATEMADALRAVVAGRGDVGLPPALGRAGLDPSPFAMTNPQRASQTPVPVDARRSAAPNPSLGSTTRPVIEDAAKASAHAPLARTKAAVVGVAAALVLGVVGAWALGGGRKAPEVATSLAASAPLTTPGGPSTQAAAAPSAAPPVVAVSSAPSASASPSPSPVASSAPGVVALTAEKPPSRDTSAPKGGKPAGASSSPAKAAPSAATQDPNSIF
jgi:eukaryotic-like serine/threonine-protein kinase